jgi:hypothetical protein
VDAVRDLLETEAAEGTTIVHLAETLTTVDIAAHLYTAGTPDPDIVIRTSGEQRLSGCRSGRAPTLKCNSWTRTGPCSGTSTFSVHCDRPLSAAVNSGGAGLARGWSQVARLVSRLLLRCCLLTAEGAAACPTPGPCPRSTRATCAARTHTILQRRRPVPRNRPLTSVYLSSGGRI